MEMNPTERDERVQRWLEIPQDCVKTREGSWTYQPPNLRDERGMGLLLIALWKKGCFVEFDPCGKVQVYDPATDKEGVVLDPADDDTNALPVALIEAVAELGEKTQWK